MSAEIGLDELERFMLAAISHEDGLEAGLATDEARLAAGGRALAEIVLPSTSLAPAERLSIYADMYYWRLVDVLGEDYDRLRAFLGGPLFVRLARAFIHRHPSRRPNLAGLGGGFPEFLRDQTDPFPGQAIAVDLALVERAFERVFDAAEDPTIAAEDLLGIDPGSWADLRLDLVRAHEILRLDHDIAGWLDAGAPAAELPRAGEQYLLAYRRDFTVFRLELAPEQAACLQDLARGSSLVEALIAAAEVAATDLDDLAPRLEGWFRTWTAIGLFARLHHG